MRLKNYSYKEFLDIKTLQKEKKKSKLSVGLALPIYNEAKTIGQTIKVVLKCKSILDEIKIIDSGSSDKGIEISKSLGIETILDKEISKKLDVKLSRGKGWNLWASLYALNTDIVAWIDTDIQNIHPRFILGIIGPFLKNKNIVFTKGYYKRPKGDARVTELMVRPLINQLFPKLKWFVQPLSGEYAAKRSFLEKTSFTSGYSVEMKILTEAVNKLKSNQIAQVYLEKRIHKLQDVSSLGKMSASIMLEMLNMANKYKKIKLINKLSPSLLRYNLKNSLISQEKIWIKDKELPPMVSLKSYRNKFKVK